MIKTLITVPSYNRPYDIEKTTLYWLKKLPKRIEYKIFVRYEQARYYEQVSDNIYPISVVDYRETINAMSRYCREYKYDIMFRIDDDMSFKTKEYTKKIDSHKAFVQIYDHILNAFKKNKKLGAVSIAKPMTFLHYKKPELFQKNKIIFGNHICRANLHHLPIGIHMLDDIYMTLRTKQFGYEVWRYMGGYENSVTHKNVGGLQSMKREHLTKSTIRKLQDLFPQYDIQLGYFKNTNKVDIDIKKLKI